MKKYKITELAALTAKYKKIDAKLNVEDETNEGRSIMVNMKTSIFEALKQKFMILLKKHELVTNVQLVRTAKANTKNGAEADMEYHMDLELIVEDNTHSLKLKCFNTNCRIQIQHAGKKSHLAQSYLKNKTPTRFLAEEIVLPICQSINEEIDVEKETEFVIHLKKEIARIKRLSKAASKNDKPGKCVNGDCKHHKSLDLKNTEKYAQCRNCEGYEHYNCANIDEQRKIVYQSGEEKYLCTECLVNFPMLALEVLSTGDTSGDDQALEVSVGKEPEVHTGSLDISVVSTETGTEKTSFQCEKCGVETVTKSQLELHDRLQHIEVINYCCQKCDYSCNKKTNLDEHVLSIHSPLKYRKCDFASEKQQDIDVHEWTSHFKCNKCDIEFEMRKL